MGNDQESFPDHYSFSQRYGYEPLPKAMALGELSKEFRREACNVFESFAKSFATNSQFGWYFRNAGSQLFASIIGEFEGVPDYEVDANFKLVMAKVHDIIKNDRFDRVLHFLEILLRQTRIAEDYFQRLQFATKIQALLQKHNAAYRLSIEYNHRFWFFPCESEEHAVAVAQALELLQQGEFEGAKAHLRHAVDHINGGRHAAAIAESIHAVESVARKIDPKASKSLSPALKSLQDRGLLTHDALCKAFEKLYGYTSNEQGIRHALIDKDAANVDVAESVFMFGACASFAGYLVRKQHVGRR
ncbi:MAG: hypothetical protein OXD33_09265 [Rhodobacteraceae bacterium]|nr:hypothetical protein [Paracoccaceae bacterium]